MKHWEETVVAPDTPVLETMQVIERTGAQIALVVGPDRRLAGTVTDGDVRRGLLRGVELSQPVDAVMKRRPTVVPPSVTREQAVAIMQHGDLRHLPVVDGEGCVVGMYKLDEIIPTGHRDNWVVLMAGGGGTRLRPLTADCPKPMVEVGGAPILEIIIRNFVDQGFRRFFVSVNFKAEVIMDYFGDGSKWGVQIEYLREDCKLGTAGCLSLLPERPELPLIVMNGDLLTKVRFNSLLDYHQSVESVATMCIREHKMEVPFGVVSVDGERIRSIEEKPVDTRYINAGIYALDPEACDRVPGDRQYDMTSLFRDLLADGARTYSFPIVEYWIDIGHLGDLERAKTDYLNQMGAD